MCPKLIELLSWNGPTVNVCCFMLARASTKTFVSRVQKKRKYLRQPKNSLTGSLVSRGITVKSRGGEGVNIVTRLGAGRTEVRIPTGPDISLCCRCSHRLWARRSRLFNGYRGSLLRVKRPGRDVNHSSPPSAVFRNQWSHAFAHPAYLHDVDGNMIILRFAVYRSRCLNLRCLCFNVR